MEQKAHISFQTISRAIRVFPFPAADLVIGIGRGGIVPASLVAHQLQCELKIVNVNHRDDNNHPLHDMPVFIHDFTPDFDSNTRILLIDDVSVTGKTLAVVKLKLKDFDVNTFVLKGKADFVLFPEIRTCVNWPWKALDYAF